MAVVASQPTVEGGIEITDKIVNQECLVVSRRRRERRKLLLNLSMLFPDAVNDLWQPTTIKPLAIGHSLLIQLRELTSCGSALPALSPDKFGALVFQTDPSNPATPFSTALCFQKILPPGLSPERGRYLALAVPGSVVWLRSSRASVGGSCRAECLSIGHTHPGQRCPVWLEHL